MPWKTFLARTSVAVLAGGAALTLAVFAGVRLATADPGGPTRDALTYAGVLRMPPSTPTALFFEFNRAGATCNVTTNPVTFDVSGAFSVDVPIACPGLGAGGRALFNGDAVTYTVRLGSASGELLTPMPVPITPVPYARFADQVGVSNDCPVGYSRDTTGVHRTVIQCVRVVQVTAPPVVDRVIRVGSGPSAFWIDRYESSVWVRPIGTTGPLTYRASPYPTEFPANGQWRTPVVEQPFAIAYSVGDVTPGTSITWFQASEACAASGKRLPTGDEWLRAAQGTPDPTTPQSRSGSPYNPHPCYTGAGGVSGTGRSNSTASPLPPGDPTGCISGSGAEDMIGNIEEWTAEWAIVPAIRVAGNVSGDAGLTVEIYPGQGESGDWSATPGFRRDIVIGSAGRASWRGGADFVSGLPAAVVRGGGVGSGEGAGVLSMRVDTTPSGTSGGIGFRCVIPR